MAHEVGHNLGLHHDHSDVYNQPLWFRCPREGHIMSPSRGTVGEVSWSDCSAQFIGDLDLECLKDRTKKMPPSMDHDRFGSTPGNHWGAKRQCELLLKDEEAYPDEKTSDDDKGG